MPITRYFSDRIVRARYRLIAEPPFTVDFPSAAFRVEWSHDGVGRHVLQAARLDAVAYLHLHHYHGDASPTARVPWTDGISVTRPSVCDTVLQRMVRDGRAELLWGPHCQVSFQTIHAVRR